MFTHISDPFERVIQLHIQEIVNCYGRSFGLPKGDDLLLLKALVKDNLNYSGAFDPDLFRKTKKIIRSLTDISSADTPSQLHLVRTGTDCSSFGLATISDVDEVSDSVSVYGNASIYLDNCSGVLTPTLSGGPIINVKASSLKMSDFVDCSFWFYGKYHTKNGGISITVKMRRWLVETS